MGDTLGAKGPAEDISIHIVEPTFDVQEERGHLAARALASVDCIDESSACVDRGEGREGATLVGVQETYVGGHCRESRSGNPLKDLGDCLEEDDDSE